MCQNVASLRDPFELECWASTFLGKLWLRRHEVDYDDGWAFLLGSPVVEDFAEFGGRGAKAALKALGRIDPTIFGVICSDLAAQLSDVALPHWFDQVGQIALTRAVWIAGDEDGGMLMLGAMRGRRERPALIVGVDSRDEHASHVLTTLPFEVELRKLELQAEKQGRPFPCTQMEPALGARRAEQAMRRTDETRSTDIHEMYAVVRALGLAYLHSALEPRMVKSGFSVELPDSL
jgi:hypothetical protein